MADTEVSTLWDEALSLLEFHRKAHDSTAIDVLNRLVSERVSGIRGVRLGPDSCTIREDRWPIERLASAERKHQRDAPRYMIEPVIVVAYAGRTLLIDGNNRVNEWLARGERRTRRVLIMEHG